MGLAPLLGPPAELGSSSGVRLGGGGGGGLPPRGEGPTHKGVEGSEGVVAAPARGTTASSRANIQYDPDACREGVLPQRTYLAAAAPNE